VAFSGYVDLTDLSDSCPGWRVDLARKIHACWALGIPVLRLFTGAVSSLDASKLVWQRFFERLEYVHALADRMWK
jgi:3-dehydroshikimate dehydratase